MPVKDSSRRQFLKSSAALGGSLVLPLWLPSGRGGVAFAQRPPARAIPPNAFLRIAKDGSCTVVVKHLEIGQGTTTALPMLLAEELECDWARVRYELAPAGAEYVNLAWGVQGTGGSSGVSNSWEQLRTAGAQAREMLKQAAADQWKVKVADVRAEKGSVVGPGGRKLGYGQLAEAAAKLPVPEKVELKPAKDWKVIGKPMRRLDSAEKVNGKAVFGIDLQQENLHVALVTRQPAFGGDQYSLDAEGAKTVPGVTHVIELPSGVAVVARNFWAAKQGRDAIKVKWTPPKAGVSTEALAK
jgi:isoquinoline 1-oxidoreductase beta subunit